MQIGFIGAGNMASALARGWAEPVLVFDAYRPRAQALVDELGGEVVGSNAELAQRVDAVLLAHKPGGLERVADEVRGEAKGVISILGGVAVDALRAAYGAEMPVVRMLPSVPVEVRDGVSVHARDPQADAQLEQRTLELFARVGSVVSVDESQVDAAMGLMSCAPAYVALVAEAQIDAGAQLMRPIAAPTWLSSTLTTGPTRANSSSVRCSSCASACGSRACTLTPSRTSTGTLGSMRTTGVPAP